MGQRESLQPLARRRVLRRMDRQRQCHLALEFAHAPGFRRPASGASATRVMPRNTRTPLPRALWIASTATPRARAATSSSPSWRGPAACISPPARVGITKTPIAIPPSHPRHPPRSWSRRLRACNWVGASMCNIPRFRSSLRFWGTGICRPTVPTRPSPPWNSASVRAPACAPSGTTAPTATWCSSRWPFRA